MCRQPMAETAKAFPFCSERCRLLDLGNWLDERYVVPTADDDTSASLPGASSNDTDEESAPPGVRHRLDD